VVQDRSERTRDRLLEAAEALLQEKGLEGATVPKIARRAGVAVGSVYRRFPDKDAMLRAVHQRYFDRSRRANLESLAAVRLASTSAHGVIATLVQGLVRNYHQQKRLLAALVQFAEDHPDAAFRRHAEAVRVETFDAIAKLLIAHKKQIHHPHPEQALEFSLKVVGAALKEFVLKDRQATAPDRLAAELTELVTAYMRIEPVTGRARTSTRARG